ncbi:MAG TPA: hypothetical protein VFY03_14745 [Woeseiaceae bacterium]|nr:hypothetical protein [Woeseiaceae bacterium]
MRTVAVLALLLYAGTMPAASADRGVGVPATGGGILEVHAPGIRLFDLHEPGLMGTWGQFLATTRMLNEEPLPPALQNRLMSIVATYQALTPVDRPAFFVAQYFDLLSERLLSADAGSSRDVLPMQVCPVFASGADAPVSSLLALASGLPDDLFVDAPGEPDRYRYLFLQTEFSHCRFLATLGTADETRLPVAGELAGVAGPAPARLSFTLGTRSWLADLNSADELRALVETVGDVDAIAAFRSEMGSAGPTDEADVLAFIRLLSLFATRGSNGYAAVPVLCPLLIGSEDDVSGGQAERPQPRDLQRGPLQVADALALAYAARTAFLDIVPFPIRTPDDLLGARLAVMEALAEGRVHRVGDERVDALLHRFVTGAELLLPTLLAQEKTPPIGD